MEKILKNITLRIFAAWFSVLAVMSVFSKDILLSVENTESISLIPLIISAIIVFVILSAIRYAMPDERVERYTAIISSILYLCSVAYTAANVWIGTVCAVGSALILLGLYKSVKSFDIPVQISVSATVIIGIFIAVFIGIITVMRYLCFYSPNFDFGIWCNMFHHMKTGFLPTVSCERDRLLSHFAVHISPIWYLILPFYCIFPSPITLQIAQAVILASGVIPVWLLSRKFGFSHITSVIWCGIYALFPALSGGCCYDIHENCFLAPLLLWLFYFAEKSKPLPMYIFTFLTLCVKEDAAVYIAFFAIYLFFARNDKKHAVILFAVSVLWFCAESYLMNKYGLGVMNYRYGNYFTGEGSMVNVAVNVIKNPSLVLKNIFTDKKIEFILCMLIPIGFLPFCTGKKLWRLILVCPFLLVNVMTDYIYQYSIYFQYVFGSLAFLIYGSLITVSDFDDRQKRLIPTVCLSMTLIMFLSTVSSRIDITDTYNANRETYDMIDGALNTIPDDASVRCSTFYLSHIADRNEIYPIDSQNDTDYIVIDLRYPSSENAKVTDTQLSLSDNWICEKRIDGIIAIWKYNSNAVTEVG